MKHACLTPSCACCHHHMHLYIHTAIYPISCVPCVVCLLCVGDHHDSTVTYLTLASCTHAQLDWSSHSISCPESSYRACISRPMPGADIKHVCCPRSCILSFHAVCIENWQHHGNQRAGPYASEVGNSLVTTRCIVICEAACWVVR